MRKIVIPTGMMEAAREAINRVSLAEFQEKGTCRIAIEAALDWLSANPIVPTEEQLNEFVLPLAQRLGGVSQMEVCGEWQRRMFALPETGIPNEVKLLLIKGKATESMIMVTDVKHDADVIKAFQIGRGQK